ncbi:MAG TPA: CHAT domain-containing tetratricopeptide repeat protein [Steroidobacteraceae bacterium]|nr:CHAT domain-containing tetratricopeptide repeat protein [Steroidobacteraceae bacterium]
MGGFEAEPLVEYSTEINVQGTNPQTLVRQLRDGVYLLEIRERDIDLRVKVEAGDTRTELGDAYLRHGLHRLVVRLKAPAAVRLTLQSIDQRSWRGAAAVRILRWPRPQEDAPPDERLLGYEELGHGNELMARPDKESWDAAVAPLRAAIVHFQAAKDTRAVAETEYQLGWLQYFLLYDYEDARRTAEAAESHFSSLDDDTGMHRAAMLRAMTEFALANTLGPEVPRSEQRDLLDRAVRRLERAREYFAAKQLYTDEISALNRTAVRPQMLGDYDACAKIYQQALNMALARHDKFFEAGFSSNLGFAASRKGEASRAVQLYERALPLIERDRNPDMYATIIANLGYSLVTLGEFDRALMLHTEALDVFMQRGDDSQTARELAALAAIQFRSGNVERALATIESALPLYERSRDFVGQVSALRLAGNAAAELDQHDAALEYLRRAEREDKNSSSLERTRVLIAGELRQLGDLESAERKLAPLLDTRNQATRADVLAERARLRQRQGRPQEALADLRQADAIYQHLKLDFDRIDTSSALAMALLATGDVAGATAAADTAIAIETRIRVNSANPEMRARFLAASYAPYEARIEIEFAGPSGREPDSVWKAFRVAEGLRARSLADRLAHGAAREKLPHDEHAERLRETMTALQMNLERQIRRGSANPKELLETRRLIDETRARLEARQVSSSSVRAGNALEIPDTRAAMQAALPEDTAVLAYFVGDRRSHAWLLTRGELRHAVLPGRHSLEGLVNAFIDQQRLGRAHRDPALASLLGNLLGGVGSKRLVVLPDGPLNGLPFAALPMPNNPRELLIDRFVISAAPSLALALRPAVAPPDDQMRVAVISDPVYTPDDRRLTVAAAESANFRGVEPSGTRLARLPYSAIEARAVVRAFEGADVIELAGFNATARRVIELPSESLDVLHFATHAVARRDAPEQSALFLSEYAADGSPLPSDRLTADDITRSGLRADVVVLSGCATGDGRELRGEGVLGLTYGFLANGSHTVIASLWPVEDALTARFMEEFYTAYRHSGRAADALRVAQLRSRGTATAAVWSSFVVRSSDLP